MSRADEESIVPRQRGPVLTVSGLTLYSERIVHKMNASGTAPPHESKEEPSAMKNAPLSLFAFDVFAPAHLTAGSWRAEGDQGHRYTDLKYWTGVARMLEDASFDGIFFADTVGLHDVYGGSGDAAMRDAAQFPINDPTVLISGMAAVTEHLTFGVDLLADLRAALPAGAALQQPRSPHRRPRRAGTS